MTVGELLQRTRAGGVAHAELTAARGGAGTVRFTGTCDFDRGVTTLERDADGPRTLWVRLTGDEIGLTAGGEPEQRLVGDAWAGHDVGRSGAGLLALLDQVADTPLDDAGGALPAPAPEAWIRAVAVHVTGIPLPHGRRAAGVTVRADADGRLAEIAVTERRVLGAPRVTHALRLTDWR